MPLYEYQCSDCGQVVEVIQKYSDPVLSKCESCGGALERLVCAPAIQFKGTGWYVTDYSRKNGKGSAASEAPPKGETGEKKSAGDSDSKAGGGKGDSSK